MSADDEDNDNDNESSSNEAVDSEQAESAASGEAAAVREEAAEVRSNEARSRLRSQMQAEIDAFLKRGGHIEVVEATANAQESSITAGVNDLSQ